MVSEIKVSPLPVATKAFAPMAPSYSLSGNDGVTNKWDMDLGSQEDED